MLPRSALLPAFKAPWLWKLGFTFFMHVLSMLFYNHSNLFAEPSLRQLTNSGFSHPECMSVRRFGKYVDLFFFLSLICLCFVLFSPNLSSCGCRMTQIGNTISGVTGLRSVWWTLVMLSPSLLTPGSKCMHGRFEKNQTLITASPEVDCKILPPELHHFHLFPFTPFIQLYPQRHAPQISSK